MKTPTGQHPLVIVALLTVVAVLGSMAEAQQPITFGAALQDFPITKIEAALRLRQRVWITDSYLLPNLAAGEVELHAMVLTRPGTADKMKGVRLVVREEVDHRPVTHNAFLDADELPALSDALALMLSALAEKPPSEVPSSRTVEYAGRGDVTIGCSHGNLYVAIGGVGFAPPARASLPLANLQVLKASIDRAVEILAAR